MAVESKDLVIANLKGYLRYRSEYTKKKEGCGLWWGLALTECDGKQSFFPGERKLPFLKRVYFIYLLVVAR
jgi:hypothetical protein